MLGLKQVLHLGDLCVSDETFVKRTHDDLDAISFYGRLILRGVCSNIRAACGGFYHLVSLVVLPLNTGITGLTTSQLNKE